MSQVVCRRIENLPYPLPPKYGNLPMQNAMMNWWSWYFHFLWQNSDSMIGPWKSGWRIFEQDWVYLSLSIHRKGPLGQAYGFSLGMMILVYSRMKRTPAKTGQRVRLKSLNRWERMRKAGHNNLAQFFRVLKRPQHVPSIFYLRMSLIKA